MGKTLLNWACDDAARLVIAVLLVAGSFGLVLAGRAVPDVVWALDGAAVSFYFSIAAYKAGARGN